MMSMLRHHQGLFSFKFLCGWAIACFFILLQSIPMATYAATNPVAYGSLTPSNINCHGINLVSIVAHMDDDLLFVDPGISDVLAKGGCVTTIFMVGGSSGKGFDYVLKREAASKRAYARMIGVDTEWTPSTLSVGSSKVMSVEAVAKPELRLVFLRVPGGNVRGGNVPLSNIFDLQQEITSWSYTDIESGPTNIYTKESLITMLTSLIEGFGATELYALNPDATPYIEHPDHIYSARFVRESLQGLPHNIPVFYHETYPSASSPPNVSPAATQLKRDVVATYFYYEGTESVSSVFSEAVWNGNWVARRNFKSAQAHDTTPTVNVPNEPLVNLETQQCLTSNGIGSGPYMGGCTTNNNAQLWSFVPSPVTVGSYGSALLKNQMGNCVALVSDVLVEKNCDGSDSSQQWTPWDFGKIFAPGSGRCLDAASQTVLSPCGPYTGSMLWARNATNLDSDMHIEVALVGDVVGDGSNKLVQIHRRGDGPGINLWVSSLGESGIDSKNWFDGKVDFEASSLQSTCGENQMCYDQSRYLLADFDGDGKADLMVITPKNEGGSIFKLLKSNGSAFDAPEVWYETSATYDYGLAQQYLAGDFRGSGRQDVLIAHTRGDSGLNFWIMANTGTSLSEPVRWAEVNNIANSAQLFTAKLNADAFADVFAVDSSGENLRLSTFQSTGSSFNVNEPIIYPVFFSNRSKVTVINSLASHLTDIWILHARADGSDINFWKIVNNGLGGFSAPSLVYTEHSIAWANVRPYPNSSGNQILLPYRVSNPVGEYYWRIGPMGVKALNLTPEGVPADIIDYGKSDRFEWANLQWRARLN